MAVCEQASPQANQQAQKANLELFVGNLPPTLAQAGGGLKLVEFLNDAILKAQLNTEPGGPVVESRVSAKFAFIIFRSPEEATNALNLTGISFLNSNLKIERTAAYAGSMPLKSTRSQLIAENAKDTIGAEQASGDSGESDSMVTEATSGLDPATRSVFILSS